MPLHKDQWQYLPEKFVRKHQIIITLFSFSAHSWLHETSTLRSMLLCIWMSWRDKIFVVRTAQTQNNAGHILYLLSCKFPGPRWRNNNMMLRGHQKQCNNGFTKIIGKSSRDFTNDPSYLAEGWSVSKILENIGQALSLELKSLGNKMYQISAFPLFQCLTVH